MGHFSLALLLQKPLICSVYIQVYCVIRCQLLFRETFIVNDYAEHVK